MSAAPRQTASDASPVLRLLSCKYPRRRARWIATATTSRRAAGCRIQASAPTRRTGAAFSEFDLTGLRRAMPPACVRFLHQTRYLAEAAGMPPWSHQANRRCPRLAQSANGLLSRLAPSEVIDYPRPTYSPRRPVLRVLVWATRPGGSGRPPVAGPQRARASSASLPSCSTTTRIRCHGRPQLHRRQRRDAPTVRTHAPDRVSEPAPTFPSWRPRRPLTISWSARRCRSSACGPAAGAPPTICPSPPTCACRSRRVGPQAAAAMMVHGHAATRGTVADARKGPPEGGPEVLAAPDARRGGGAQNLMFADVAVAARQVVVRGVVAVERTGHADRRILGEHVVDAGRHGEVEAGRHLPVDARRKVVALMWLVPPDRSGSGLLQVAPSSVQSALHCSVMSDR